MQSCPHREDGWCDACIAEGAEALDAWWRAAFPEDVASTECAFRRIPLDAAYTRRYNGGMMKNRTETKRADDEKGREAQATTHDGGGRTMRTDTER